MASKSSDWSFDAEDQDVGQIIFHGDIDLKYVVPAHQRPYMWKEDNVVEFWSDFLEPSSNFIGSFIFNNENRTKYISEIIDGQQRLLTITIFLSALRNKCLELGTEDANNLASHIQTHGIEIRDRINKFKHYRIICGDTTQTFFQKYIQSQDENIIDAKPESKEEQRIRDNYSLFMVRIENAIKHKRNKDQKLDVLTKFLDELLKIKIIKVDIDSEEGAYEVFETVNARGLTLSPADLLKNLIFNRILSKDKSKQDLIIKNWKEIVGNVQEENMTRFLRHYWLSNFKYVSVRKLFKEIKKERRVSDYEVFLEDLVNASFWYGQILNPIEDSFLKIKKGSEIYEAVNSIRTMNVQVCHPFTLCLLSNAEKIDWRLTHIFEVIEKFTFAYNSICNKPSNKVEKLYAQKAQEIEKAVTKLKKKVITKKQFKKNVEATLSSLEVDLKDLFPSEAEFTEAMNEYSLKNSAQSGALTRYLLSKLDKDITKGEAIDYKPLTIEHILPQDPSKWGLRKKDVKDYVQKLGNLTLVGREINSNAHNFKLDKKVPLYRNSKVALTKPILVNKLNALKRKYKKYVWSEEQINDRQEALSKLAWKVFII
ncbi:MAG: DUF262 domain-containing HNH endonuclease family protein [Thermoleophilia bacterium]|nr:DUF262 domain-containing HNH endonuclease family protein [Thermoleophilia bacterium]